MSDGEKNAVINSARLFIEDHGILTVNLDLSYGGHSFQGFGGRSLFCPRGKSSKDWTGHFVSEVFRVLGVTSFDEIAGCPCRVTVESGIVESIAHITEDRRFSPREYFDANLREAQ